LAPFILGVTAVGVVMAVVYNRTGGNLLLPIVIHWQLNVAFWPEAQPWENYLNVALAVALVWAHRDVMFSRSRGATTVIPA
jgi:membrane protease YdiL (CAAX protease family)